MLGPVAGGSVRLSAINEDGHLGIAEGLETALAAQTTFGLQRGLPYRLTGFGNGSGRKASAA
jgi:hypothetical protein